MLNKGVKRSQGSEAHEKPPSAAFSNPCAFHRVRHHPDVFCSFAVAGEPGTGDQDANGSPEACADASSGSSTSTSQAGATSTSHAGLLRGKGPRNGKRRPGRGDYGLDREIRPSFSGAARPFNFHFEALNFRIKTFLPSLTDNVSISKGSKKRAICSKYNVWLIKRITYLNS
jgi:hypothetical protein